VARQTRGRGRLLVVLAITTVGAALAHPSASSAATTCAFTAGSNLLEVDMDGVNDRADLSVAASGHIDVGNPTAIPCSGGDAQTVDNIDTIEVAQGGGAGQVAQVFVSQFAQGGPFEPGATAEATGASEIEFEIDLADGFDTVHLLGQADPFSDHFRFGDLSGGDSGANLNAPESGGPDGDDLRMTNVDSLTVTLGFLETVANTYDGSGGPEFTGPLSTLPMGGLGGSSGPDIVIGGDRGGIYDGFDGADTIVSSPETPFSETLRGGVGVDTLDYSRATSAVTIDLGTSAGQVTGGGGFDVLDQTDFEDLIGGPFGDTLTGTSGPNRVVGAAGNDTISLLEGDDRFEVMDGGPDTVECGLGADSGVADVQGVDTINANCETVDFPPQTSVASGPANGATITDRTPTYGLAADEAATFERRVDGGGFQPCPQSCTIPSLSNGIHTVAFRATDQDPPATPDPTPVSRTVRITNPQAAPPQDTDPPETTITRGPKKKTRKKSVSFSFSADEPESTFECALDGAGFAPCGSPTTLKVRKRGKHQLAVRATDEAGNTDQTPAEHRWKRKKRKRR
jgi:RTX calcium-binding nonapeptide repeat (4 copies)